MKKMGWGFGLAAAGMVFLASHALAQGSTGSAGTEPSTGSSMGAGGAEANQVQGKVEKFDRAKNTLTLSGSDKTIKVDQSTKVMKDGASATLDDIKEGEQVRASYSGTGTTVKAKSLEITTTAGPSGMEAPPAGTEKEPGGTPGGHPGTKP